MTGLPGNEGGQGGWNQPPDPYGADPYGNQYGQYPADPYAQGGYGPDPNQQDPYGGGYSLYPQAGGFQHPQAGGFPEFGPPQPPRRSRLPMILGVLAIVIIVGAVVAIVLVNRDSGGGPTAGQQTTSEKPAPTSAHDDPSSREDEPSSSGGSKPQDGWQTIDNTADAAMTYQVPGDWKPSSAKRASGLGVDFTGAADYGVYDCQGASYARSFVTSGDVQSKDGKDLDLASTVTDFAKSFATTYFDETAEAEVPDPEQTDVGGRTAMTITASVTPRVTKPKCQATKGEIAILGVLLEDSGKPAGVTMLAVVSDIEGGPADPKPLPTSVAKDILASVSVTD